VSQYPAAGAVPICPQSAVPGRPSANAEHPYGRSAGRSERRLGAFRRTSSHTQRPLRVTNCPPLGEVLMTDDGEIVAAPNTRQTPTPFPRNTAPRGSHRRRPVSAETPHWQRRGLDSVASFPARVVLLRRGRSPGGRECRYRSDRGTPTSHAPPQQAVDCGLNSHASHPRVIARQGEIKDSQRFSPLRTYVR
jgi:hypothetical protein